MLPGPYRMRRGDDFVVTVRRGRRAGRRLVVLHTLRGEKTEDTPRVGFVVSRAVGNAVIRNRVQRRLRHVMAERVHRLPGGSLVVVRAKPPAAGASSAELSADIDAAWERVERQCAEQR